MNGRLTAIHRKIARVRAGYVTSDAEDIILDILEEITEYLNTLKVEGTHDEED